MNSLDQLPDELKWSVIKFMKHPTVDMIHEAERDYKAHLRGMERQLDSYWETPPFALIEAYEEITLLKYLKQEQEDRHERNKYFRERREGGFHAQEWFCDYVQCLTRSAIVPTVLNATSLREIAAMSALVVVMTCITTEFVYLRFL
jgi:hypothetical protein